MIIPIAVEKNYLQNFKSILSFLLVRIRQYSIKWKIPFYSKPIAKIIYNLKRLGTFPVIIKSIRKTHQFLNKQRTSTRNSQKKKNKYTETEKFNITNNQERIK